MKTYLTFIYSLYTIFSLCQDKGTGIFYVSDFEGKCTITIHAESSVKSRQVGVFVHEYLGNGQVNFSISANGLKEDNLVEYGYEKLGLPFCDIAGEWVKVIYGFDYKGKPMIGWVRLQNGIVSYFHWKEYLNSKMLFFSDPDQIIFFDRPNGKAIKFQLVPSQYLKFDYIMRPLENVGIWMKVEVTTPSNYCDDPQEMTSGIFWIKYLDENGRPLVWYFTRGC